MTTPSARALVAVGELDLEAAVAVGHASTARARRSDSVRSSAATSAVTSTPMPPRKRHERRASHGRRRRRQPAEHAAVLELERAELRERRRAARAARRRRRRCRHQRLDEHARTPRDRSGARRTPRSTRPRRRAPAGPPARPRSAPCPPADRSALALERVEVRGNHPGQPLRQRVQLVAPTDERAVVLGPATDQLAAEAELLAQPDAALLAGEEAVGRRLDDEAADVLGEDLPAEARRRARRGRPRRRERAARAAAPPRARRSRPRRRRPSRRPRRPTRRRARSATSSASAAMNARVVVQRGRTLEPHPELGGDGAAR